MQKIVPHLWFDTQAKEASAFYCQAFPNSKIVNSIVLPDTPSGDCDLVTFNLNGHDFMAISAGPLFNFNSSISFMVNFDPSKDDHPKENLQKLWDTLMQGGAALMPLQKYRFSELYGWVQDKFGVTWQLILTDPTGDDRPFIVPSLMFAGDNTNKAGQAVDFYVHTFKHAARGITAPYTEDTGPAKKGSLMFADFMLEKQWFAAMDSGVEHDVPFNEAISMLINCDTQEEIDYYWGKLSAVPEAEQCGWLKDKFGVVWQVSPTALNTMLSDSTPEQMSRVTKAFLKMKKFNLAEIEAAYRG